MLSPPEDFRTQGIFGTSPALVRVLTAPEPFYASPPRALPTPKPAEPAPEESEDTDSGS